jgi:hypothetical protein
MTGTWVFTTPSEYDELVKASKLLAPVIPAKAGIQ